MKNLLSIQLKKMLK